jgi:hypothetical protein
MRALIDCYNDGAGGEILILVDGGGQGVEPTATVTARSGRAFVLAVEGAELWVRASEDGAGTTQAERWIGLNRTDQDTAGYVLQNWLAQLEPCDSEIRVRTPFTPDEGPRSVSTSTDIHTTACQDTQ